MDNIIEIKNVTFSYEGRQQPALNDVSLDVHRGEILALIGSNGSGKTTLAKQMNAVYLPDSGSVSVDGINTSDENRLIDIRRRVGMVFQNPDNQIVSSVVEEDVAFALENLGVEPSEMRRRVDSALAVVGMTRYATYAPNNLSGGQKQRIAIAGVIAMEPDCIIMDEATAMLDPRGRKAVLDTVKKLNREKGITVVMITHYMEEAAMADRIVVMHRGSIDSVGTPSEIFSGGDHLRQLDLDVPPVTALCCRLAELGLPVSAGIVDPALCVNEIFRCISEGK